MDVSNIVQQEKDNDAEEDSISEDDEEKLLSDDIDSDEFVGILVYLNWQDNSLFIEVKTNRWKSICVFQGCNLFLMSR